jgi:hypothetical protein
MKEKKIEILRVASTKGIKWSKLPLDYKILIIILAIVLLFVPILMIPTI